MIEGKPLSELIHHIHPDAFRILVEAVNPTIKVIPIIEDEAEKATQVDSSNGSEKCRSK